MRKPVLFRIIIVLMFLVCVILAVNLYVFPSNASYRDCGPQTGWSYLRGYCIGMGFALKELNARRAVLVASGDSSYMLDKETGLNIWASGCCPDRGMDGYSAGFNWMIHQNIRWNGYPENSRKQWEDILFNLNAYFDERARTEEPVPMLVDGPPITAPDGKTLIYLKPRDHPYKVYHFRWEPERWGPVWPISPIKDVIQYFPGPPGSDVLIFRGTYGRSKHLEITGAFDLRKGWWLKFDKEREVTHANILNLQN